MYLARLRIGGKTHYVIRQSYPDSGQLKHRDLFNLGTDPARFIHYPGGNGYYYDAQIEQAFSEKGVQIGQNDLDAVLFEFLDPEIQRVITGFDRSLRKESINTRESKINRPCPVHLFDKRRFHYLRFGQSRQRYIHNVPVKVFQPLQNKSRDELEHYFWEEERKLRHYEKGHYVATVFGLTAFHPEANSDRPIGAQLDDFFMDQLCGLNEDESFMAGESGVNGLYEHLIKYAIIYFDFERQHQNPELHFIRDFIRRHRQYRSTGKTKLKIKEIEALYGREWKELKSMSREALTRLYRKLALQHHPDRGGNAETFKRLAHYYRVLLHRKPKS